MNRTKLRLKSKRQLAAQQQQAQQPQLLPNRLTSTQTDLFIGDPDAPVTIIEFTDYGCPFCSRHFENTYPFLKSNYVDTRFVKYVFKDFPLSFHPEADEASKQPDVPTTKVVLLICMPRFSQTNLSERESGLYESVCRVRS